MLIKEFRVILPLTVEEYQVGQLYSVAQASKNETGGGEGIEVLRNEPFENYPLLGGKYSSGQYTYKIYHLASIFSSICSLMNENNYAVITNPDYMRNNFYLCIETMHAPDCGEQENVHNLPPEKLKQRDVVFIDIANDHVESKDYKELEDPRKFKSKKTGRGPLVGNWQKTSNPVMCAYKLVTIEFKWFGLQNRVESLIQKTERRIFLNFHRQVFCWIDSWYGLTMEDIRTLEDKTKKELEEQINQGPVRGTQE
ncbi:phosphatidylinositol transfer protein alpha isoform-like [Limulus polyphemus]|uniref:Phosphatidylinositol transfer protein alpha isoform-like n=1 Tax=Limulus polyphemus TaxID=6850 RepID=A0ABM1SE63_LIMPO|nr:phosphatidylinositol transfer protein alpha isoform-like [Limulus polyphemus]